MPAMPMPGAGGPPSMGGGGMPGGAGSPPMMPKNPSGGPSGPGSSPALSPGAGQGATEAARAQVKMMLEGLYQLQGAFPVDSDEFGAVQDAIRALRTTFKKSKGNDILPAGIQQMAMQAKQGNPFDKAQPVGMQQPGKPPMPPAGPMPGGM